MRLSGLRLPNQNATDSGGLNNRHLFLMDLQAGSPGSEHQYKFWWGSSSGLQRVAFSFYPHMAESREGKQAFSWLLKKHWSRLWSSTLMTSSNPNYLLKALPPNTITLGGRVSTYKFQGAANILIITACYVAFQGLGTYWKTWGLLESGLTLEGNRNLSARLTW